MKARLLAVAVLVILAAAVMWQWRHDDAEADAQRLTTLDPDAIQRIDVSLKGYPPQHFAREGGHWIDTSGQVADQGRADELASLAATPVSTWNSAANVDAEKLGLMPPLAVLTLDGTRLDFGDMAALGKRRYVRVGERIAIVPAQTLPRPPSVKPLTTLAHP